KPIVAENIKNFTNSNNDNFYILSTRKDKYIESLSSYIKYNIKPLEPEEGIELLKRYVDKNEDKKFFDNIVEEESLESFLSVPLLASMIYMAYKPKENLPKRKVDLYDQVFEALYTSHDRNSKGGYIRSINYTSQKIIDILCKFSFKNIINLEVLYLKEEIEKQLLSIKDEFLINNISDLLETLTIKVPLFTSNFNTYFWKHKSFQEYFIALYISRNNQKEKIIKNMINSEKNSNYYNILEFLYELEKNIVLKEILEVIKNKYREIEKKINISDERIINLLVNNTEVYLKKNLIETIDGYVTLPCPIFEDKYEEEKNLLIEELEKEYQGDFQNLELNYSGQSIKYKKYYGNRVYLMKKTNIPILLKLLKNKKVHIVKDINNLKNKKYETKNFFEKNMWIKIDVETIRVENLKIEVVTDHMNSFGIINISEVERLYKNEITIYELNKLNLNENNIIENL
ncbi:MAG: hypothetical protein MJH09_12345, partial [Cetobacterium sp.]|nr:hypothetical protein [Cetobacterium sp.]